MFYKKIAPAHQSRFGTTNIWSMVKRHNLALLLWSVFLFYDYGLYTPIEEKKIISCMQDWCWSLFPYSRLQSKVVEARNKGIAGRTESVLCFLQSFAQFSYLFLVFVLCAIQRAMFKLLLSKFSLSFKVLDYVITFFHQSCHLISGFKVYGSYICLKSKIL